MRAPYVRMMVALQAPTRGDLATLDEPVTAPGDPDAGGEPSPDDPSSTAHAAPDADGPAPRASADPAAGEASPRDGAPSRDVVVTRAVLGMVAYERLARVVRALGHASYSLAAAGRTEAPGRR